MKSVLWDNFTKKRSKGYSYRTLPIYLWPKLYFQPESSSDVESGSVTPRRSSEYAKRRNLMLLAVAYSASIGGTGVVTGTPSNLIILEVFDFVN